MTRGSKIGVVAGALLALGMSEGVATAQTTLLSNMPGNDATQSAFLQGGRIKAMGFTMPGEDYLLTEVVLRLDVDGPDVRPLVRIFSNSGGLPGSELVTLDAPPFPGPGISSMEFRPPADFTLEADETYWLVVWNEGAGNLDWKANNPGITPTGIATHAGSLFSTNTGPNPPTGSSSILNSYEVRGTEPSGTCIADWNGDGEVDINDFFAYLSDFEDGDPRADLNNDGEIDINDFFIFLTEFEQGC